MIVKLRLIPDEGLDLEGREDPAIIDLDEPGVVFEQPIVYCLRAVRVGRILLVRGRLETTARIACVLCLKEYDFPIRVTDFARELEVGDEEIIDLTEDVREDIILALPVKPVCGTDCRGLCPLCGGDLNEGDCGCSTVTDDSPFAKLNRIFPKKTKG